jgi:hypothetical protein
MGVLMLQVEVLTLHPPQVVGLRFRERSSVVGLASDLAAGSFFCRYLKWFDCCMWPCMLS